MKKKIYIYKTRSIVQFSKTIKLNCYKIKKLQYTYIIKRFNKKYETLKKKTITKFLYKK